MKDTKLNEGEVKAIYNLTHTTNMTYSDIAYLFNVCLNTVSRIARGEMYIDITNHMNTDTLSKADMDELSGKRMTRDYKNKQMIEYYKTHKISITSLANKFNVSFTACKDILLKHDLIYNNTKERLHLKIAEIKIKRYMEVVDMYHDRNVSVTDIAKKLGISTRSVYSIIDYAMEQGVEIKRRNG